MCGALTKAMRCRKRGKLRQLLITIGLFMINLTLFQFYEMINSFIFYDFLKLAQLQKNIGKKTLHSCILHENSFPDISLVFSERLTYTRNIYFSLVGRPTDARELYSCEQHVSEKNTASTDRVIEKLLFNHVIKNVVETDGTFSGISGDKQNIFSKFEGTYSEICRIHTIKSFQKFNGFFPGLLRHTKNVVFRNLTELFSGIIGSQTKQF